MKNLIVFCFIVSTSIVVFGQKKARFSNVLVVSGSYEDAHTYYYDATITYGADCYQIYPFVPATLKVLVTAFEYKGKKYSGNDIPGFQFPFQASDGFLKITAKIRYKINSSVDLYSAGHLSINYSNQGTIDHMKDRLSLTKSGEDYIKNDVERCSDWVKNAGDLFAIKVLSGSIGTNKGNKLLNYQLIGAIKNKEKLEKFNANISDGNSAIDEGRIIDAQTYLVEAKKNNPNTANSNQQITSLTDKITTAKEKEGQPEDSTAVASKSETDGSTTNANLENEKDATDLEKINKGEAQKKSDYDTKVDEYAKKQQLQEQKYAAATELSVAALLIHYYIGTLLYSAKNNDVAAEYQNYCSNFNMRFGYGGSYVPITTKGEDVGSYTIDMNFGYEWAPVYSKNFGFSIFADVAAGHSIAFTEFKLGASGGIKTHLGPIAYNYRQNWMKVFYNDWLNSSNTSDEMEKFVYSYGRNEIGLTFNNEHFNVDALFLLKRDNDPNNEKKFLKGGRIELYKPNGIRFFAEYMQLKQRLGNYQNNIVSEDSPFLVSLGVLNNFNYFGDTYLNDYSGKYINKRLQKKKTFFFSLNSKFTRGTMFLGEEGDTISQSNMDLDLQILFEKEILLYNGLYGTIGGGISGSRGFKGDFVSLSKSTINHPFYSGDFKYSSATFDIPVGILYKVKTLDKYNVSFWSAFKAEFVIPMFYYNVQGSKRPNGEIIELSETQLEYFNSIKKTNYTMLQIGFGVEHYINLYSKMRWGIFYEIAPKSIFQEPVIYKPNGFIFKASMTL